MQHYNFNIPDIVVNKKIFNAFRNIVENFVEMCRFYTFQEYFKILQVKTIHLKNNNISKI